MIYRKDNHLQQYTQQKRKKSLQQFRAGIKLHSIDSLETEVKNTSIYNQLTPKQQLKFIDNCHQIMHFILSENYMKYWGNVDKYSSISIKRDKIKKLLGSQFQDVLRVLEELGYIHINKLYYYNREPKTDGLRASSYTRRYALTDKAKQLSFIKVDIITSSIKKKIIAYKHKHMETLLSNDMHVQMLWNLYHLDYTGVKIIKTNWKSKRQRNFFNKAFKDLKRFQKKSFLDFISDVSFFYSPSSYGRVYNYFTSLPKEYVKGLTHKDGSKLEEIDGKAFQPMELSLIYCEETGSDIYKEFEHGDWYEKLALHGKDTFPELYKLFQSNRKEFKVRIISECFYMNYSGMEGAKLFKSKYPDWSKWIIDRKHKYGYKALSHIAHIEESNIFIKGLYKEMGDKYWYTTRHDSALIKEQEYDIFKETLIKLMEERFTFVPDGFFKNRFDKDE